MPEPTDPLDEYRGPKADAKAALIEQTLGTETEILTDVVWLLRYITVKHSIQWATWDEVIEMRRA